MKKLLVIFAAVSMTTVAWAAPTERYLHVRLDNADKQMNISIDLPVSVATQVLPAVDHGAVHDGKISVGSIEINGVDVVQVLGALKNARDGESVTIQQRGRTIRVAKREGELIVHVSNSAGDGRDVDINVPWEVAEALVSSKGHDLDVRAGIQALEHSKGRSLVTVARGGQRVSIWVDTQSSAEQPSDPDNQN